MSQEIEDEFVAQRKAMAKMQQELEAYQDLVATSLSILNKIADRIGAEIPAETVETPIAIVPLDTDALWTPVPPALPADPEPRDVLQQLASLSLAITDKLDEPDRQSDSAETNLPTVQFALLDAKAVPGTVCVFLRHESHYKPIFAPNSPPSNLQLPLSISHDQVFWAKIVTRHSDAITVKEWKWKRDSDPSEIILHQRARPITSKRVSIRSKSPSE